MYVIRFYNIENAAQFTKELMSAKDLVQVQAGRSTPVTVQNTEECTLKVMEIASGRRTVSVYMKSLNDFLNVRNFKLNGPKDEKQVAVAAALA